MRLFFFSLSFLAIIIYYTFIKSGRAKTPRTAAEKIKNGFKQILRSRFTLDVVSSFELINTAARIYKFLLACKERMTFVAYIHFKSINLFGSTRFESCAASANHGYFVIVGMYFGLHIFTSLLISIQMLNYYK